MSSRESPSGIVKLMSAFNFEMSALPDDLKCLECKSVLKDACQVPCGCRFCRTCIDHVVARGGQFCPGGAQECGETPLSTAVPDYRANRSILKLSAKCAHADCPHECPLADMEQHLRVCCLALADEDMSSHMQQASRSPSEILIGLVANINRDMEKLKNELMLKDERERHLENEIKLMKDELKSVRKENKSIKDELDSTKCRMESVQVPVKVVQLDDWLIDADLNKTAWDWLSANDAKTSGTFRGGGRPHKYDLESWNFVSYGELRIRLRIWAGPSDALLEWPFSGALTVTVANRNDARKCVKDTMQCKIERPPDNQCSYFNKPIIFKHAALREAGLDLRQGVRVSCQIVLGAGQ